MFRWLKKLPFIAFQWLIVVLWLIILFDTQLKYLLADNKLIALSFLNVNTLPEKYPLIFSLVMLVIVVLFLFLAKFKSSFKTLYVLSKGLFFLSLVWLIAHFALVQFSKQNPAWNSNLFSTTNFFVEVLVEQVRVRKTPDLNAPILNTLEKGEFALLVDGVTKQSISWNKILIKPEQYGWIARKSPNQTPLVTTNRYYFKKSDLFAWLSGLAALLASVFLSLFRK